MNRNENMNEEEGRKEGGNEGRKEGRKDLNQFIIAEFVCWVISNSRLANLMQLRIISS